MRKFIVPVLATLSLSAFADTDYSRCNSNFITAGISINNDSKVVPSSPFIEISDIKTEGKKETYTIKGKNGANPGFQYGGGTGTTVSVIRDDQGRIASVIIGDEKPNDKSIKEYKSNMASMMGTFASGTYEPSVYFDPNAGERADGGTPRYIPVSQLSKKDLLTMGIDLSPEDLKKMQKQWKKDKKTQKKLADAYAKIYQSPQQYIPMGTSAHFEFVDGSCVPSLITSNAYYEKNKTVSTSTVYSKNECEDIERVFLKHQKKMTECQSYEAKEMAQDWNTIYGSSISGIGGGYGMGMGIGMMGFGGYGGFGGGSSMSQLQMKKMNCDMYKNGSFGGYVGGSASGSSTPSQSKTSNQ